jgi:glycosyltransferase involved in cell wall biosynthesis
MNCKDSIAFTVSQGDLTDFKEKMGISEKFVILYDGWLIQDVGVEELLSAIERLKPLIVDLAVLICGSGNAERDFKKMATTKKLDDVVFFTGEISTENIPLFVNSCDVMYVVYKIQNKYSLIRTPSRLFEAIICAKPIIVSNYGQAAIIVKNGKNGLAIDSNNVDELCKAILRLREDANLRRDLTSNAKKLASIYNWASQENELCLVYERCTKANA